MFRDCTKTNETGQKSWHSQKLYNFLPNSLRFRQLYVLMGYSVWLTFIMIGQEMQIFLLLLWLETSLIFSEQSLNPFWQDVISTKIQFCNTYLKISVNYIIDFKVSIIIAKRVQQGFCNFYQAKIAKHFNYGENWDIKR